MKKLFAFILTLAIMTSMITTAFAQDYSFSSGTSTLVAFGKPTSNDDPVSSDPMAANERRNKDAAYFPPSYGIFSGEIPTEPSSLLHNNATSGTTSANASKTSVVSTATANSSASVSINLPEAAGSMASTSAIYGASVSTEPRYYDDGSIGTLFIPKINKTIKVYQGESLDNLKIGAGHFEMTSAWDGSCGFAGHNRGSAGYFSFVKDLAIGDKIIYTTPYGMRTYEVFRKDIISETDYSGLGWSANNLISLITCHENQPQSRILTQAREIW